MLPYWLLFALFAIPALIEPVRQPRDRRIGLVLGVVAVVCALMIGLRYHVGADFEQYQYILRFAGTFSFGEAISFGDPAYQAINWMVARAGGSVWHVNLICAAIFTWGLVQFCRQEPFPMLAGLVAVPYLIIVVAMGYTRQGVAIGIIMAGMAALFRDRSVLKFAFYVAFAALFHRTAVLVLPLAIFAGQRNHFLNAVAVLSIAYGLYDALLADSVDQLVENYIDARYNSQGAAVRLAMSVLPALIVLQSGRRLEMDAYQLRLWRIVSYVALALVPALFLVPSTTAIDRIALYLLPLQLVAIGRLPYLFNSRDVGRLVVTFYCFAILFVWLHYAAHAFAWVPYRLTPIFE